MLFPIITIGPRLPWSRLAEQVAARSPDRVRPWSPTRNASLSPPRQASASRPTYSPRMDRSPPDRPPLCQPVPPSRSPLRLHGDAGVNSYSAAFLRAGGGQALPQALAGGVRERVGEGEGALGQVGLGMLGASGVDGLMNSLREAHLAVKDGSATEQQKDSYYFKYLEVRVCGGEAC